MSQLSGFTALAFMQDSVGGKGETNEQSAAESQKSDEIKKFPGSDVMKSFSVRNIEVRKAPEPKTCIIEMINIQLRVRDQFLYQK